MPLPITNIALNRPVYASSVYDVEGPNRYLPGNAVDGITTYDFMNYPTFRNIYHSGKGDSYVWFSVDLGKVAVITHFIIWSRCDLPNNYLRNTEFRIGNVSITNAPDSSSRIRNNPIAWNGTVTAPPGACTSQSVYLATPGVGRWVTIQAMPTENGLVMAELQIFGYIIPGRCVCMLMCKHAT